MPGPPRSSIAPLEAGELRCPIRRTGVRRLTLLILLLRVKETRDLATMCVNIVAAVVVTRINARRLGGGGGEGNVRRGRGGGGGGRGVGVRRRCRGAGGEWERRGGGGGGRGDELPELLLEAEGADATA
ncbi:hypothetical protein MLD38_036067 [Melastoma candidum]|uniref:Uncharacterized protein n=1 Tax=Melastoma candidum TaxID=119954 RepID=A0ACB9LKD8_9MYRT|nr:hypothetical protein MLD38_036067 [Melastoma candidum]